MYDYDKLFAEGNIIGISPTKNEVINLVCSKFNHNIDGFRNLYSNNDLSYENIKIQYIIRLDEKGNVVERLFDREEDMPNNPIPSLEDGMFIRIRYNDYSEDSYRSDRKTVLGYVDMIHNRVLYQNSGYAKIENGKIKLNCDDEIVEVYKDAKSFGDCLNYCRIWRDDNYQHWLDLYGTN